MLAMIAKMLLETVRDFCKNAKLPNALKSKDSNNSFISFVPSRQEKEVSIRKQNITDRTQLDQPIDQNGILVW